MNTQLPLFDESGDHRQAAAVKPLTIILFIDGASRGNPGKASIGCVIKRNNIVVAEHGYYLGIHTNNQAEYAALLVGLYYALPYLTEHDELLIISDSLLLVKQIQGSYRVKDPILQQLWSRARQMLARVRHRITHVLRSHNTHADILANRALDAQHVLPDRIKPLIAYDR